MIGITAGLKTSDYWCLLGRLLLLPCAARGSVRRRGNTRASVLFAGQKPYPTWRQALPPPDDPGRDPPAKEPVAATPTSVAPKPRRSLVLPIVLGISFAVVAVGLVGFLVTLTSRPAPPPKTACAALPALEAAPPPLTAAPSNSGRPDDRSRGAPCKARTAADPNWRCSAGQSRSRVRRRIRARLSNCSRRLRSELRPIVLAPLPPSRPLELAPARRPDKLRPVDRGLRHLGAYRVSAGRHASGSPFGSRRPDRRPPFRG